MGLTVIEEVVTPSSVLTVNTPQFDWMTFAYIYWTMTPSDDSTSYVRSIEPGGSISGSNVINKFLIRPVVELYKTATITKLES